MHKNRLKNVNLISVLWGIIVGSGGEFVFFGSTIPGGNHSIIDFIVIVPGAFAGIYAFRCSKNRVAQKRREKYLLEFRSFINAMQGPLEAGCAMERALSLAERDLTCMYGKKMEIVKDVRIMERGMQVGKRFEDVFSDFADKSGIEEIEDFAVVISGLKRRGGNAVAVIRETIGKIAAEIGLKEEIATVIAAKQLEQRIMIFMPGIILLFLLMTSGNFAKPLYESMTGRIFMTVALALNIFADWIGKKIVDIR